MGVERAMFNYKKCSTKYPKADAENCCASHAILLVFTPVMCRGLKAQGAGSITHENLHSKNITRVRFTRILLQINRSD